MSLSFKDQEVDLGFCSFPGDKYELAPLHGKMGIKVFFLLGNTCRGTSLQANPVCSTRTYFPSILPHRRDKKIKPGEREWRPHKPFAAWPTVTCLGYVYGPHQLLQRPCPSFLTLHTFKTPKPPDMVVYQPQPITVD